MNNSKIISSLALILSTFSFGYTQEKTNNPISFDLGADITSSYIWRGLQLDNAPNIQGWGELSAGNFFIGAWASSNFNGNFAETDVYVGYTLGNLTATLTDYFSGSEDAFNYKKEETGHSGELMLEYSISDAFPLKLTAGTIVFGSDLKLDYIDDAEEPYFKDNNNYSTYLELMYPFTVGAVDFEFAIGGTTHESYYYSSEGAAITNINLKTSKSVKITSEFELPIAFQVVVNPELETFHSVFMISF